MPRHTVRLLATIGACSALALALSSSAGAVEVEVNTPHINIPTPRINVPKPHVNVPTMNNVPTVNLRHHRLSTGTNALTNGNKLGGGQGNATGTTTANTPNTPFVGPSDAGGSAKGKVLTETVGGSAIPTQVQQQNAAAAAIGGASSGTGSPGGQNTSPANTWDASLATSHDGGINVGPVPLTKFNPGSLPPPYGSAAYYNWLTGGGENAAYTADRSALQGSALQDFESLLNYLLFLLGLTQDTASTGYSFTPYETALIEAAITQCLASPSTCAATVANLEAELQSLGVPASIPCTNPVYGYGSIKVYYTPSQITAANSYFSITAQGGFFDNELSYGVLAWQSAALGVLE